MRQRVSVPFFASLCAFSLLAGCGGGGGSSAGAPASSPQKTPIGNGLVAEAFTTGSPITVAGSGSSVIGLTGTFSNIVWNNPSPKNEHSLIAFTEWGNLNVMDWNGTNLRTIYTIADNSWLYSVAWFGDAIFFIENNTLKRIQVQGGTPTTVLANVSGVAMSPIGPPRLALIRSGDLYIANPDGSNLTLLTNLPELISSVKWADSRFIDVETTIGWRSIRVSDGQVSHDNTIPFVGVTREATGIRWLQRNELNQGFVIEPRRRSGGLDYTTTSVDFNIKIEVPGATSPDDRFFILPERNENTQAWGAARLVRRSTSATGSGTTVYSQGELTGNIRSVDVQPFVRTRLLTGPGSPFAWTAHALMWANAGTNPSGLALVRANNGNSIRISAGEPTQTGANIFYTVECDALTKVAFTVDRSYTLRDLPLTSGNNGVIFSFNSANGEVQSAFTYTVTRSEAKPTIERIGGRARISGSITGGFDRHGNPILPSGASLIEVDEKGSPKVIR